MARAADWAVELQTATTWYNGEALRAAMCITPHWPAMAPGLKSALSPMTPIRIGAILRKNAEAWEEGMMWRSLEVLVWDVSFDNETNEMRDPRVVTLL